MSRPNWSRPLKIPTVMTLKTLADVRELTRRLPKDHRAKSTWRHVEKQLNAAPRQELERTIGCNYPVVPTFECLLVEAKPIRLIRTGPM